MDSILYYGNTDLGRIRTNNEDAYIAQNIWDDDHVLAVAIDGVGGYEGGEIASAIAQKSIVEYLEKYPNGECSDLLKQAVVYANNTIFQERKKQPNYGNMSCVLTAVLIEFKNRKINLAHIGDTRLYQFSNEEIVKLSHDHSLVGYREEIGELTELEAMKHPQRNVIGRDVGSKYLNGGESDYIEVNTFPLLPHSTLLLCSDGLYDMITSAQMKEILCKKTPIKEKVKLLIKAANDAGGKDNVTVVLVESNYTEKCHTDKTSPVDNIITPALPTQNNDEIILERQTKRKTKGPLLLKIAIVLIMCIIGYFTGGYTGYKFFPSVFHYNDDLLHSFKEDTTVLHNTIREQESLINTLQDIIGYMDITDNGNDSVTKSNED